MNLYESTTYLNSQYLAKVVHQRRFKYFYLCQRGKKALCYPVKLKEKEVNTKSTE